MIRAITPMLLALALVATLLAANALLSRKMVRPDPAPSFSGVDSGAAISDRSAEARLGNPDASPVLWSEQSQRADVGALALDEGLRPLPPSAGEYGPFVDPENPDTWRSIQSGDYGEFVDPAEPRSWRAREPASYGEFVDPSNPSSWKIVEGQREYGTFVDPEAAWTGRRQNTARAEYGEDTSYLQPAR